MQTETTEVVMENREIINNVMCLLTDPDGNPLGAPIYLPQNAGPQQLQQIVNKLLNNVMPFSILTFILHKLVVYYCYFEYLYSHFRRRNCHMLSIYPTRSSSCHLKHTCRKTKVSSHIWFQQSCSFYLFFDFY